MERIWTPIKEAKNGGCPLFSTFFYTIYYNYDAVERKHIRCVSYSSLIPLWAQLAPTRQAQAMIERYVLNPAKLWSPYGIRSLAADELLYNNENVIKPYSNWQGPIWPHGNWMAMHALIHYGYGAQALAVAERVTRLCLADLTWRPTA